VKAIYEKLLTLGAKVVIASRNEEKVIETANEMSKLGTIVSRRCNIRIEDDVTYGYEFLFKVRNNFCSGTCCLPPWIHLVRLIS
jgi:short-subunit dehydrogenase involved in D-alanine esterification of teichoic acids